MKQKLLKTLVLLCALIVGSATSWADNYKLVKNVSELSEGDVILIASGTTGSVKALGAQNSNNRAAASVTVTDGVISSIGDAVELTLDAKNASGNYTLKSSTGYLYAANTAKGTKNYLKEKDSKVYWSIEVNTSTYVATIKDKDSSCNGKNWLLFNSNSALFSCYSSGQDNVYIYKKEVVVSAVATPTFSVDGGTYTKAQSVELSCETDGATIYYTLDGSEPTESSTEYTSAIAVATTTTIKAKAFKGGEASGVATATYTILPVHHAGTVEDPYTVADARNAIDANTGLDNVYVSGIVCEGAPSLLSGAMSYWISYDGSETDKFYIYKGKGLSGADFTATSDVQVGDVVVVYGTIMKFDNTIYEFKAGSQLSSLVRPAVPRILTTPATISELEYVTGNGPSDAQTFTVSGSNLTANITLALSGSDFEMSLSEGSGYTNSLTLTQTEGAVAETTVYVRLKEGLEINDYAGTITLTSADATTKTIDLTGSVTPTLFTWDLSTDSYDANPTEETISWTNAIAVMENNRNGKNTAVNNYIPTTQSSTRFYKNNILTISPTSGYMITRVVFTATSENYASTLKSSAWTNATAKASGMTVTVTPTDGVSAIRATIGGACGFTAVKVYYQTATATINIAAACTDGNKCYGTYSNSKAFIVPADLTVYEVSVIGGEMLLEAYAKDDIVPANTGVLVAGTAGEHNVVLSTGGTSKLGADNMLRATGTGIDAAAMAAADASCKFYRLTMHGGTQIGFFWGAEKGAAFAVAANKAYLAVPNTEAGLVKGFRFGENTDAISEIMSNGENEKMSAIYDLSGRRVVKPTKGLYIVNGKKVVK